jgi:hypothetical protein
MEERNEGGRNVTYIAIENGDHRLSVVIAEGEDTVSLGKHSEHGEIDGMDNIQTFSLPLSLVHELAEVLGAVGRASKV